MSKKSSSGSKGVSTKRQVVREKRIAKQRRQRILIVLGVVGAALIIAAIVIVPSFQPVGDVVAITPHSRPMVDGRAMGDSNAPVLIDVYSDFQCPACKTFAEQIEQQVVNTYVSTGQVYYIYRHFPFIDDRAPRNESDQAANASMCASDENRFWDFHDILFANWDGENQGAFNDNRLVAFAESLGLDMPAFNNCFNANLHKEEIDTDYSTGRTIGVTGTPSVFVNGLQLTPGFIPSFEEISQAVEAELSASGN